jgi:hypothetical protein
VIGIALAAAFSLGGCTDTLCQPGALAPFFAKLRAQGPGHPGRPVHILQIGDSHTAGDAFSGAWRDLLQARYGSGGRGVLPPGRPYEGYLTHGVTVAMSPGWKVSGDFGSAWSSPSPPLGVSAYSLTSQQDGATMSLSADPNELFDRFTLCALARPGAGTLALRAGTQSVSFDLSSPSEREECRTIRLDQPAASADVTTSGGPVTITSWATFRDGGGVALSNLGVVGSQLIHFARTDDQVIAEELRAYQPDLIVLAFGTNEGFAPRVSPFEYEIVLRTQIGRLKRLAGNVPILLLGAPDALSRRAEMRGNAPGQPVQYCPELGTTPTRAPAAVPAPSPAVTQGVIAGIMERLRSTMSLPTPTDAPAPPSATPKPNYPPGAIVQPLPPPDAQPVATSRPPLFPPPGLAAVRDVQRRVAASLNVAFWDWQARMGGACTANKWVHASPPLMRGDYVHYTAAGGRELAQRLEADLDKAGAR